MRSLLYAALLLLVDCSGYAQCSPACGTGGVPPGFQAIVLGAPFKYYGKITAINATMYIKTPSFAHAIFLQIWRPVNQTAFTLTASQFFFADPVVTEGATELQFPSQFRNQSSGIQLPFNPNDVFGYYVITDTTKYDLGFADSLSPYIVNSSEPSSINVYTTNSSGPPQFFSISSPPSFPNAHLLITIVYTTVSPSPSVGGSTISPSPSVGGSTITVLGACPQSNFIQSPMDTPTSISPPVYQTLLMPLTTSATSSSFPSSSPTISTPPPPPESSPIAAIIVGIVVGIVVVCILPLIGIIVVMVCYRKRRRRLGADDMSMQLSIPAAAST
ncbi:hypothetical protein EMCRGX_G022006 [Ephydatia muelleri]